jgi:conjugative relaxase-like TrwC/TraI family protein
VKFYRGGAGAARAYVEAGLSRADDYYLAEGDGVAARYAATADGRVQALGALDGDGYEAWVAGVDPDTGLAKGRLRSDANALRFCEVVINGPKSWSLAAELHLDVAAAHAAAQASAAEQVVGWFAGHASSRVGPRGGQYSVPVEAVEACAVAHRTSRCGDPHRHIHLQINARVEAEGKWRGIDSVAVRESITAAQGVGHAAMVCDPGFRAALAAHGYTLDAASGEIEQLAGYTAAFSKRHAQVTAQAAGYEQEWRVQNPGVEPGWGLRRGWDTRAWAAGRPGKIAPVAGEAAPHERWAVELHDLGFRAPDGPVELHAVRVGALDRDTLAEAVLSRLGSTRSAFNGADLRGTAELAVARAGVVAEAVLRAEVVEDITARAAAAAVPLLERPVPEHVRAWTSAEAVAVEAELADRFAGRAAADAVTGRDLDPDMVRVVAIATGERLDPAQVEAVGALAGGRALVTVTGAAGAGKTTTLAVVRAVVEYDGHQVLVVTPTLKAARAAEVETGAAAGSAAWLAHQHGWRWDTDGRWTRLQPGASDPAAGTTYRGPTEAARLGAGDLLVVDEAGMVDADTARALLRIADETGARVALVGDPRQLPAVGRGGVLEQAARWTQRDVTLDVIHRFTRTETLPGGVAVDVPDSVYAELTLQMRQGAAGDPGAVFDKLAERGQVQVHPDVEALREAVADQAAAAVLAGRPAAVSAATNSAVAELNTGVRDRLVAAGHVDDVHGASTAAGQRIGVGDTVVTRANDRDLGVANRDSWTVTRLGVDGSLAVTPQNAKPGSVGEPDVARVLPREYVSEHVQLGYAATVHGVQGATAQVGHLVLDDSTTAAGAYVGMTRGRVDNTVHVVAPDLQAAREQWIRTAAHERADTGIEAAREAAAAEADRYPAHAVEPDPVASHVEQETQRALQTAPAAEELEQVAARLHAAWTTHEQTAAELERAKAQLAAAQAYQARHAEAAARLAEVDARLAAARREVETLAPHAKATTEQITQRSTQLHEKIHGTWEREYEAARAAARDWLEGPGRLGLNQRRVDRAEEKLQAWAGQWRHLHPHLDTTDTGRLARQADMHPANHERHIREPFEAKVAEQVRLELPDAHEVLVATKAAQDRVSELTAGQKEAGERVQRVVWGRGGDTALHGLDRDPAKALSQAQAAHGRAETAHSTARAEISAFREHPALATHPDLPGWVQEQRGLWQQARTIAAAAKAISRAARAAERVIEHETPYRSPDHGRGRDGPDLGR